MTDDRFAELMRDDSAELTASELATGWHFCPDWDGLLVSPSMWEWVHCTCPIPVVSCTTVDANEWMIRDQQLDELSASLPF